MAKEKSYNSIRNLSEDWGRDERNGLPYSGQSVQEVIKRYLMAHEAGKFGSVLVTTDESKLTTVRFFSGDDAMEAWQEDPSANASLLLRSFTIQGAGEASEYTLAAKVVKALSAVQVAGAENIFTFTYSSYWGSDTADLDPQAGAAVVTVNGTEVARITTQSGGSEYSIDVGRFITQENNSVRITVRNAHGKSRTWEYTVEAKSLGIAFAESYLARQHVAKAPGWSLPVVVSGVGGTVYVRVDDGALSYSRQVAGGTQASFAIDGSGLLERGTHSIEVWCEDSVYGLKSGHIATSYIAESQSMAVAIGAGAPDRVTMYDTVQVPYYFYSPADAAGTAVDVTVAVSDENGATLSTSSQKVTVDGDHSSGLRQAVVQVMDNAYIGRAVTVTVSIGQGAGTVSAQHVMAVGAAGTTLREAGECKVYYNMAGKTNSDTDVVANAMESRYGGARTSRLLRSGNFTLKEGSGFGGGGFTVPAQRRAVLKDWLPFGTDSGVNGTHEGRSIEMEFSIGIAADMDKPVISCMDGRCGFEVYPTRIEVKYAASDARIVTYFPDGERIKFSLVVNGTATECVNDDGNGTVERQERNLGFLYVNGVMVRIFDYGTSSWKQDSAREITFGSDECVLTLYSIRGYDKALSMREVLDNFSYDTPLLADKMAIAKRNDVLQSDGVTIDRNLVEKALPGTPVVTWWMERLPANKKDPQECRQTDFTNPGWTEERGYACAPFTAGPHTINGDGTSSNAYPLPYKNWAETFKDYDGGSGPVITLHLTGGDALVKKYSITYGIDDAETKFVHKVNFASSEGIFNILAMNMYQQITLAARRDIDDLLSLQQQGQADAGQEITFRKSLSGFPEIGFRTYTENGQVVTKFLSIYNFISNKKTGSMFGMAEDYRVNQLWEVDENRNFFNTPMTEHGFDAEGNVTLSNGVRDDGPLYYSRFPADSPVNKTDGKANDLGLPTSAPQVAQANDEIRALRLVHNWIVSVNPNVAERYRAQHGRYRALTVAEDGFTGKTYAGTTFTQDTPAYRAQKFIDECASYLHVNDCIFYFVFCVYYLGMDSMDKNMSLFFDTVRDFYSDDPSVSAGARVRLRIMLRDTDTGVLFNNSGVLAYRYWHEWNDTYREDTGETGQITGETWDAERQAFSIQSDVAGSSPVFNGRMSGLWDAVSRFLPGQVRTVYLAMRRAGLNYGTFMAMYEQFRSCWCEALYNVDGLGYANTGKFTMAYGDKLMVSRYFFKYRERYMDSKYGYASDAHQVTLRLSSVPNGIWMKHCTPLYASFSYGSDTPTTARSIKVGEAALLPCTANTFNDATCYINDADLVTEIGTYVMQTDGTPVLNGWEGMQNFHFTFNFQRLVRLRRFIWANTAERPNTEQTVANGSIEFGSLTMLRELVMTYCTAWAGQPVVGSDIIERIDFRGTPITGITVPETATLKELHLPATLRSLSLVNLPSLTKFTIDGTDVLETLRVEDTPVDVFGLLGDIYGRMAAGETVALRSLVADGIDATLSADGLDLLMWLAGLDGCRLSGKVTLDASVALTYEDKERLTRAFGNIDSDDNDLRIVYSYVKNPALEVAVYGDGLADVLGPVGTTYQLRCIPHVGGTVQKYASYISRVKWTADNYRYFTIDKDGVMTVISNSSAQNNFSATVTVTATLADGTVLKSSLVIYCYNRPAALGDYVYVDGSYSRNLMKCKTLVGIVVTDENGVREVCAVRHIGQGCWGLLKASQNNISGVTMDGSIEAYDTPLPNIITIGTSLATDANSGYFNAETDSFVAVGENTVAGNMRHTTSGETIYQLTLDDGTLGDRTLDPGTYAQGYVNTLKIIGWRNRILAYAGLGIPRAAGGMTERASLDALIAQITAENDSRYDQYYFPAASMCFAYQPVPMEHETLSGKLAAHRWYLPSSGTMARIVFYLLRNDEGGNSRYDVLKDAKERMLLNLWPANQIMTHSSTECNDSNDGLINQKTGEVRNYGYGGNTKVGIAYIVPAVVI